MRFIFQSTKRKLALNDTFSGSLNSLEKYQIRSLQYKCHRELWQQLSTPGTLRETASCPKLKSRTSPGSLKRILALLYFSPSDARVLPLNDWWGHEHPGMSQKTGVLRVPWLDCWSPRHRTTLRLQCTRCTWGQTSETWGSSASLGAAPDVLPWKSTQRMVEKRESGT